MTKLKITVLIYTARGDYPYVDKSWHCFDPFLKTLAAQTVPASDFELVLVDMHYDTRSDYFAKHPQPFVVKHVPSSPNYWQARKRTGLCAQINRGFAWADGELIWMGGENNMFPATHLRRAWEIYQSGSIPVAWYAICGADAQVDPAARAAQAKCPLDFNVQGFTRAHVKEMDHRAERFVGNGASRVQPMHHQNYFGYASVPIELAIKVNGFDEIFDGQWGLFDCDFGSRLDLAGGKMALSRDLYVIEPPVAPGPYVGIGHQEAFKCHYAIYLHNRHSRRLVNAPLPAGYVEDVKATACRSLCAIKDKCAGGAPGVGESAYYPFCESKNPETRALAAAWLADPPVRDLAIERLARRIHAAPYDRGSIYAATAKAIP